MKSGTKPAKKTLADYDNKFVCIDGRAAMTGLVRRRPPDGRRSRGYELHVILDVNDFSVPVRHYPLDAADVKGMVEVPTISG